ncbi:acyl-CoA thioester hydrolase [Singulisphaera sp. GP187]|uniref:acyl-CoA thioesterase n=1 Tax=Singulisphaera sp. GP187 TaxID=1882752 RepID=UPI00092B94C7|nr:thioesterase family protein [Singulisphaera sp. GP187]SIO62375.1 acyl-CoA thioester hydrolase [Singulisphaera sp. GP187]
MDSNPAFPSKFPVFITLPVQWGDQDAFGHVNNTVYFRWFESSRIAYFERIGLSAMMTTAKVGPILASITCDYRRQILYPESVIIGAKVTRIGRTSIKMEHELFTQSNQALAAEGKSTIVVFDYSTNRPHPIPDPIRRAIEALEGERL